MSAITKLYPDGAHECQRWVLLPGGKTGWCRRPAYLRFVADDPALFWTTAWACDDCQGEYAGHTIAEDLHTAARGA